MKLIKPSFFYAFLPNGKTALETIERVARICYKSEDRITDESYKKMIRRLIENDHQAMIELGIDPIVVLIHNRAILNELTRHRLASFAQESTRWIDYSKDSIGEVSFIDVEQQTLLPNVETTKQEAARQTLLNFYKEAEKAYLQLRKNHVPAEMARNVLPLGIKTEAAIKCNLREWRHILKLRGSRKAHRELRSMMHNILASMNYHIPIIFEDIAQEYLPKSEVFFLEVLVKEDFDSDPSEIKMINIKTLSEFSQGFIEGTTFEPLPRFFNVNVYSKDQVTTFINCSTQENEFSFFGFKE